jgi:hypothetical protein
MLHHSEGERSGDHQLRTSIRRSHHSQNVDVSGYAPRLQPALASLPFPVKTGKRCRLFRLVAAKDQELVIPITRFKDS